MKITVDIVKGYREVSGIAMMECRHLLNLNNSNDIKTVEELYELTTRFYLSSKLNQPSLITRKR